MQVTIKAEDYVNKLKTSSSIDAKLEVCKELLVAATSLLPVLSEGHNESYCNVIRVLAFAAAQGKPIQDLISSSDIISDALLVHEANCMEPKFAIALFRLVLNTITQNVENQQKYVEKVLSSDNLFAVKSPEVYQFALIILYNTTVTNHELASMLFNIQKILRWYKAAFDFIQKCQKVGDANEKQYAEVYEWFTMLTFLLIKRSFLTDALFRCLTNEDALLHCENSITFVRNSSEDYTVIQPCILQTRFIQYLCSEIILQSKEDTGVWDSLIGDSRLFLCRLFTSLTLVFVSSYDVLKVYQDPFLSANFTQDFQNLTCFLTVFELWVEAKAEDADSKVSLVKCGLLNGCFNFINYIDSVAVNIKDEERLKPFVGIQAKAMKIVSNLCYRSAVASEYFVNHKHRLGDVLRQTKMNFSQPGLREWALLTIRHLCEESKEVRDALSEMKVTGVKIDPEGAEKLKEFGLKVDYDKEQAKVVFN